MGNVRKIFVDDDRRKCDLPSDVIWRYAVRLDQGGKDALNVLAQTRGVSPDIIATELVEQGLGLPRREAANFSQAQLASLRQKARDANLTVPALSLFMALMDCIDGRVGWHRLTLVELFGRSNVNPSTHHKAASLLVDRDIIRFNKSTHKKIPHQYALYLEGK